MRIPRSHPIPFLAALTLLGVVAVTPAQVDIALCAAAGTATSCQWTSVQTTLRNTGLFRTVDIIDVAVATPTLPQLLNYHALLCWTNTTPISNTAWGDVLADYVDAGGGVVVAVFANSTTTAGRNIGGRWQTGYEVVLDQGGNTSGAGATLGNVLVPSHPVMAGVTAFQGGTIGSRPTGTALEVGATLIAQWSDGKVLVAAGARVNRIDLGFYPPPATCSQSGWAVGGDLLMANALLYVATQGAAYRPFGTGCAGSLGVPALAATAGSLPALGANFSLTVSNLPLTLGVMLLGFSDTSYNGIPLPLDLGLAGMTGCSLLTSITLTSLVSGGTSAQWVLPIPNTPQLIGARFFNQALVIDPPANVPGLTVSNGGSGRIGL